MLCHHHVLIWLKGNEITTCHTYESKFLNVRKQHSNTNIQDQLGSSIDDKLRENMVWAYSKATNKFYI